MSDLVEFLRARLDEDEQAAKEAGNRRWLVQDNIIELYPERDDDGFMSWPTRADARHAARWEPARVLRELEGKRTLLEYCERAMSHEDPLSRDQAGEVAMAAITVTYLAVPYADHPEYLAEWKPMT